MKFSNNIAVVLFLLGLFFSPFFVHAGYDCYVDAGEESGGDGSEEHPYKKILKALEEKCGNIYVKEGTYGDNIVLNDGVKIKGSDQNKIIITGSVLMKENSRLEKVTVSGKGIRVNNNDNANIIGVTVERSNVGIETSGHGNLVVKNSRIKNNRKGFYLLEEKHISISSSSIYGNSEEGIDIRSNVDGIISGNIIENNGESGIELILGKAGLAISGNKIRSNGSSGIAVQYYTYASSAGGLKIANNTISKNNNFAIVCKIPSGGAPSANYWSRAMTLIGNSIVENKDGNFSPDCKLGNLKITNATKTEEELEAEKKAQQELLEKLKGDPGVIIGTIKILQTVSGRLNVRMGPSINYGIINSVKTGEEYGYVEKENGWYKIAMNENLSGWVAGDYAEEVIKEEIQEKVQEEKVEEPISETKIEVVQEAPKEPKILKNILIFGGATVVALISVLFYLSYNNYFRSPKKEIKIIESNKSIDIN